MLPEWLQSIHALIRANLFGLIIPRTQEKQSALIRCPKQHSHGAKSAQQTDGNFDACIAI